MRRMRMTASVLILSMAPIAIILVMMLSVLYGSKNIGWETVWNALFHFDSSNVHEQIVLGSRLPRVTGALLIGAFLAMSGSIMQGLTRNYLASPSIMGVTEGSVFIITLCMIVLPKASSLNLIFASFVGSAIGVAIVFGMALLLPDGLSPVRLAIIGTIVSTFLSSLSAAMASYFQLSQNVSFWYNARLYQIDPNMIKVAVPFAIAGAGLAIFISKSITILSLGEDISVNLGIKGWLVKAAALASVVILTGAAVALAGNIGFVGLIIPHITRFLVGQDYRMVIPCSGVLGAVFLALADVVSRFLNPPFETPIGVVTSLIGVPFFLYLIYKKGGEKHA